MVAKWSQGVKTLVFAGEKNYGGEGGILAIVISRLSEFKRVDSLPQVVVFSAFNGDVFGSRSGCGWEKDSNQVLIGRSGSKR